MNELAVKTIEKTPAKIDFNFDELSAVLDEQLKKYDGLEFTEEQVTECKKVITELNNGKKALNDYRLSTKKELSVEITEFEARCKHLSNKFDDVIKPLKEQADEFEENRKEEKREKVQKIIDALIEDEGLNEKYAAELIIENSYLNKSTTMKSITVDLGTKAEHLGIQQDKEESDKDLIKSHVELINLKYDVDFRAEPYYRLLEFENVEDIKKQMERHAQKEVEVRSKKEIETDNAYVAPSNEVTNHEYYDKAVESSKKAKFIEIYKVEGTESQLVALEEYMSSNHIAWSVIEDD